MRRELAAHVDHGIAHSSSVGRVTLGIGAAVGAVAFCSSGAGTLVCVASAATAGGLGMDAGGVVDQLLPTSIDGHIVTGHPTVMLGRGLKPAARAEHADTTVDCHGRMIAEGSEIVTIGRELKPMSRRNDRTLCDGVIAEGLDTVIVGGEPSAKGKEFTEEDHLAVKALSMGFGLLSAATALRQGKILSGVAGLGGVTLDAAGQGEAASVVRAAGAGRFPAGGTLMDKLDYMQTMRKGAEGGVGLGSSMLQ